MPPRPQSPGVDLEQPEKVESDKDHASGMFPAPPACGCDWEGKTLLSSRPEIAAAAGGGGGTRGRAGTGDDLKDEHDVGDAEHDRPAGDGGANRRWLGGAPTVVR